jgi:AcrR family transcriptional regulator
MASKDRILRLKEENRVNILGAALQIVKEEGWQALSLRKIADKIEYTAPIIYEYFANKEAILQELTRQGYALLFNKLKEAKAQHDKPADQLEAMWMAYWNFAFAEKEYYQVMYGVEMNCCAYQQKFEEAVATADIFWDTIAELTKHKHPTEDDLCTWYYTYWSIVHGLVSINIVNIGAREEIAKVVLINAITGITNSIAN